ncbi:RodZ domain-containing protein [Marinomonas ostreistagni]|uniref:RodZ domain-containing protein n=1 Tax=Marinomonas ostreistagni TaxID=359209 RepID=UPI001950A624|nr:RodZ family helix-turn-helix domain-containing protein [Marinomonas ostreistagni]MBM6551695.1 helix-turn-helix domain-containing protein [Marinomonas ostreistagni]
MTTELEMDIAPEQGNSAMDIGQVLRTKRLALAYSERHVATELKLSIDKVHALENNQFQLFRSPTFARGYLKSYCRVLDIDYRPVLEAYDQQLSSKETTIRSVDNVKHQATVRDPIVMIVSVIILAIIVFVAFWWPSFTSDDEAPANDAPVAEQSAVEPADESESPVEPTLTPDESAAQDPDADSTAEQVGLDELDLSALENTQIDALEDLDEEVVTGLSAETMALLEDAGLDPDEVAQAARQENETSQSVASEAPTQPAYSNDIVVNFSADCWTQVQDSTGRVLFSGVKSSGSTLELNGEAPYQVTLGYAPGVTEFIYKGEAFDFSSNVRNDLARFELE